jgi:hypothetical protein
MEYLNDWDRKIPNLDVVDDYQTEKKEIQACQGKDFSFNFGDVSHIISNDRSLFFVCSIL